jgi:hypothetical protein
MRITILDRSDLDGIPSGSGMVRHGNTYHIVGDDAPFLYSMDSSSGSVTTTRLVDAVNLSGHRIVKSEKPDFEAMELVGDREMVIFGSGSKSPNRDVFMRVLLTDPFTVEKHDISDFYNNLRALPHLKDSELNIEATAFRNGHIYLFNRNRNLVLQFLYDDLLAHLRGEVAFPPPSVTPFNLPVIGGVQAGFSGAVALTHAPKIIFTASVERTDNAYDDGEIMGSLIGMFDIADDGVSTTFTHCPIASGNTPLKIESVAVGEERAIGETQLFLISDDDKGHSTLLECVLFW